MLNKTKKIRVFVPSDGINRLYQHMEDSGVIIHNVYYNQIVNMVEFQVESTLEQTYDLLDCTTTLNGLLGQGEGYF